MNTPLLERNILSVQAAGINEIIISTGYMAEYIESYFGDGTRLGIPISYVRGLSPAGTGGAIKLAERLLTETFLVCNADIVYDINFRKLIAFHRKEAAAVTIAVKKVKNPSAYGVVKTNADDRVMAFLEKPISSLKNAPAYINAGIYVCEPEVLVMMPKRKVVSLERDVFPSLIEANVKVAAYKDDSYWIDIGTVKKYRELHEDIFSGKHKVAGVKFDKDGIFIGEKATIDPHAQIIGPVYMGPGVLVGANCIIGPGVVIGSDTCIHRDARIANAILWENTDIARGKNEQDKVITGYGEDVPKEAPLRVDLAKTV